MPTPFTRENAGEMARRATRSRLERIAREEEEEREARLRDARLPRDASEDAKKLRVQRQIETCDNMLEDCDDPVMFVKLVAAKARLWELLYPKPGSLRPKAGRVERAPVQPIQAAPAPLVVPISPVSTDAPPQEVQSNPPSDHNPQVT